jgi:hypothetical protein
MKKLDLLLVVFMSVFLTSTHAFSEEPRKAIVTEVRGMVEARVDSLDWRPAQAGLVLHERDEIRTAENSFAAILVDEEGKSGKLDLKEKSHLKFNQLNLEPLTGDKTTLLDLAIGRVMVKAEKLQGDSTFEVRTPNSTTGVRGTEFEVVVDED